MGRRRRGFRSLKAAKIWILLLIVAVIYTIRVKTGASEKGDLLSDLNSFGESWLTAAWWLFGAAVVLFVYFKIGGGRRKRSQRVSNRNENDDEFSEDETTDWDNSN